MNILFNFSGYLTGKDGKSRYSGGRKKLRSFRKAVCMEDFVQTACKILRETETEQVLQYAVGDTLCDLEDEDDVAALCNEYKRSDKLIMEVWVVSSYTEENISSTRSTPKTSCTPKKSTENIQMVSTPITVDCYTRTSKKRRCGRSVVRKLNQEKLLSSEQCPSQIYLDFDELLSFDEKFDETWYSPAEDAQSSEYPPEIEHRNTSIPAFRSDRSYAEQPEVNFPEAYPQIVEYSSEVKNVDSESVNVFDLTEGNKLYRYFWTYGPLVRVYRSHLRRVIIIDCYYLWSTTGILMTALAVDPDNRTFPLAFAMAEREDEGNWIFFFNHLKRHVLFSLESFVIQTARHSVMTQWITKIFPTALHVYCPFHLFEIVSKESLVAAEKFKQASTELDAEKFQQIMWEMKGISYRAHAHLGKIGFKHWADLYISRAGFTRFSVNTINHPESWRRMLSVFNYHTLPIFIQCVRTTIAKHFMIYRTLAERNPFNLCPTAEWMVQLQTSRSQSCSASPVANGKFLVQSDHRGSPHTVDMVGRRCTCNFWQIYDIPCAHAIACIASLTCLPTDLVSRCYTRETVRAIYDEVWVPTSSRKSVRIDMLCSHCTKIDGLRYRVFILPCFEQIMD